MVEFYIVVGSRSSGLPSLCKAIHDQMFYDIESANEFKNSLERQFGEDIKFAVYKCHGAVILKE